MRAPFLLAFLLLSANALAEAPDLSANEPPRLLEPAEPDTSDARLPLDEGDVDTAPPDNEPGDDDTRAPEADPADAEPARTEPVTDDAALREPTAFPRLELEGCRDLLRRHDFPAARICYESSPTGEDERVRRVRERVALSLADVSATPPSSGMDFGELFTSGKAELVASSTLFGGYLATLATLDAGFFLFQLLQLPFPWGFEPAAIALLFLSPVVGGAAGLAASLGAVLALPEMSAGDANLLRASLWLGTFNSVVAGLLTNVYGRQHVGDWWRIDLTATTTAMLLGGLAPLGVGAALAVLTDLPEAAGPLGLSLGFWGATLAVLGQLMVDLPLPFEEGTLLVAAVANAGFAAGLLTAPFVPLTRFETWLLDLGAVAGGLLGTAIVFGIPAPNPVLGWGGIGAGILLGAGAGVALGKLVPLGLELVELPRLIALGPLVLPPGRTGELPLGAQVQISLDPALERLRR